MIRSALLLPDGSFRQENTNLQSTWEKNPGSILWIDLENVPLAQEKEILTELKCHKLAISDAQRVRHPPKFEHFEDKLFLLYRGLISASPGLILEQLQIALFVGDNLLVTRHQDISISIKQWWDDPDLKFMLAHPFILAIKIAHTSFGCYLDAVLEFEQLLTDKEEAMQISANDEDLRELTSYKARLRKHRRIFNYHERLAAALLALTHEDKKFHHYLHEAQDLHERADRISSLLSMYYEICGDLIEGYLSITSHQLNRTMQILTVVTTIFVPLGFLAGIYGMNFDNMPELHSQNGYYVLLGTMGVISIGALIIFKLKRWL